MPHAFDVSTTAVLRRSYAQARQGLGVGPAIAVLHLGAQQSGLAVGADLQAQAVQLLPLGIQSTALAHFKTTPPTPLALENAIMVVEDVVMPLRSLVPRDAQLFSCDTALREVASVCGVPAQAVMVLSLDALERSFNRLSRVVEGMPAAHEGMPADNGFATALLVLRECMHHLQFAQITLLEQPTP